MRRSYCSSLCTHCPNPGAVTDMNISVTMQRHGEKIQDVQGVKEHIVITWEAAKEKRL